MATVAPSPSSIGENSEQLEARPSRFSWLAGRRKWAILAAGLLLIASGYLYWQRSQPAPSAVNTDTLVPRSTTTIKKNPSPTFQQVTVPVVADADKDGLTDSREAEVKTNPRLADSDGDELNDYDEVTVYGTNPLIQDTDGDSFSDGAEVRSGNNPKGAGKIINLSDSISNINTQ